MEMISIIILFYDTFLLIFFFRFENLSFVLIEESEDDKDYVDKNDKDKIDKGDVYKVDR